MCIRDRVSPGWHDHDLASALGFVVKNVPAGKSCIDHLFGLIAEIINDCLLFCVCGDYKHVTSALLALSIKVIHAFQSNDSVLKKDKRYFFNIAVKDLSLIHILPDLWPGKKRRSFSAEADTEP